MSEAKEPLAAWKLGSTNSNVVGITWSEFKKRGAKSLRISGEPLKQKSNG
jgi:hypothetical protein